jgi:hypothetical protein
MGCKSEQCGRQQAGKQAGRSQEQHQERSQQGALLQLTLQTHGPNGRDRHTALQAGHPAMEPTGRILRTTPDLIDS